MTDTQDSRRCGLGVNIDHIATLRNVRGIGDPSLFEMAEIILKIGVDKIVMHLREDERHIKTEDVEILCFGSERNINLEIAPEKSMLDLALRFRPSMVCIVEERRGEKTTELGTNLRNPITQNVLREYIPKLHAANIEVSCFIEPETKQVCLAKDLGFDIVELNTNAYSSSFFNLKSAQFIFSHGVYVDEETKAYYLPKVEYHLKMLRETAATAQYYNLAVHAGHGLSVYNIKPVLTIPQIEYLHIGHSIVCRALKIGMKRAISEILEILERL